MDLEGIGELFKLACLLHDVGHAPFSHTGEGFYLGKDHDYTQLHNKLIETIGNENFSKDIPEDSSSAAAPHEIMSAIIGISEFEMFFDSVEQLCDDVIYLMKNPFYSQLCEEFFERRIRRHPVWKSEAEYKAFVLDMASGGSLLEKFEQAMSVTAKYLIKSTDSWVINDSLIAKLEKEKETLLATDMDPETKKVQLENKEMILKVVHSLEGYANEKGISCNFVILMASQFNSGFGKPDFSATNIAFQTKDGEKVAAVGKIVSAIEAKERDRDNFFYLFYKRKDSLDVDNDDIDNQEICKKLFKDVVF